MRIFLKTELKFQLIFCKILAFIMNCEITTLVLKSSLFLLVESAVRRCFSKLVRGSHPEVFGKKDVLKNFAKFLAKQLCQSLFLNKVASLSLSLQLY